MGTETRRMKPADLDRSAIVLGEAFADSPWTRWTVDPRDHQSRVTGLQRLALEQFGHATGEVWVTTVDEVIQSVALWTDSATSTTRSLEPAFDRLVADLEGSRHEASIAAERQVADWRPTQRHFFLGTVGTVPPMRGRGLASSTLTPTLSAADSGGVPAFLETSARENIEFYCALRFEVIGHRRIAGGGPDVWAMLRNPQA